MALCTVLLEELVAFLDIPGGEHEAFWNITHVAPHLRARPRLKVSGCWVGFLKPVCRNPKLQTLESLCTATYNGDPTSCSFMKVRFLLQLLLEVADLGIGLV